MSALVLRSDAAHLPLPDASVDLIVTSPPYFGQRDYRDGGASLAGQIGSEETPAEYIAALLRCTREWVRVLKPSGSLFVNLGDKFSQRIQVRRSSHQPGIHVGKFEEFSESWAERAAKGATRMPHQNVIGDDGGWVAEKSLMQLPARYSIGCTDQLGLILRRDIIWSKTSGMPESVTDRCHTSHEYLFHFTKEPRYFSAGDEIREPYQPQSVARTSRRYLAGDSFSVGTPNTLDPEQFCNPLGKMPGSVWEIPTQPLLVPAHLGVDHFAAFPCELPRRIILGWSPSGICLECGEGRRPQVLREIGPDHQGRIGTLHGGDRARIGHATERKMLDGLALRTITGYACACPSATAPTRPAVVADPFGGTGTTALVADVLGRIGVTVDLGMDYSRLARWRTRDPAERARALGVPKPPPVLEGQGSLFDHMEAS
jgi:DNA modification methylase